MKKRVFLLLAALLLVLTACTPAAPRGGSAGSGSSGSSLLPNFSFDFTPPADTPQDVPQGNSGEAVPPEPDPAAQLAELLLYAGGGGDSAWHFLEPVPEDAGYNYIGRFTFYADKVDFLAGYEASEALYLASGSWQTAPDGTLSVTLYDGETGEATALAYAVADNGDGTLTLTQTSDTPLFYYHEKGHQLLLQTGAY